MGEKAPIDRDFLVNAFLARLAIYQTKRNQHILSDRPPSYERWEVEQVKAEAIEWLASEIGISEDLKAAGYEAFSDG